MHYIVNVCVCVRARKPPVGSGRLLLKHTHGISELSVQYLPGIVQFSHSPEAFRFEFRLIRYDMP